MAQPSTIYKPGKLNYVWNYIGTTLKEFKAKLLGYRTYTALLTQVSGDPDVIVLENTLGQDIVWTQGGTGVYLGTATGLFVNANKITVTCSETNAGDILGYAVAYRETDNRITIQTYDTSFSAADGVLGSTMLEIRMYL